MADLLETQFAIALPEPRYALLKVLARMTA
jgi:hypothetical protein